MNVDNLISIIVPVYNGEKFIDRCIQSVQQQIYQNWELILVDDGSTDNTGTLCDEIANKNQKIKIVHKKNGGVSSARNAGIELSSGQMLMFLDADDTLTEDCLMLLHNTLVETNADVVSGIMCGVARLWSADKDFVIWTGEDGVKKSLMDDPLTYSSCAKLYKREIIGDTRFNSKIRINEDSYFVFQILCKKPIFVGINNEIYCYSITTESATRTTFSEKFFDILKVASLKNDAICNDFHRLLYLSSNMQLKARLNLLSILASRTLFKYSRNENELIRYIKKYQNDYISIKRSDDILMKIVVHGMYYPYKYSKFILKRMPAIILNKIKNQYNFITKSCK